MAIYLDKTIQPVYPLMNRDYLYPNSIRGREGKLSHATQNLVKSVRVCTIITLLITKQTPLFDTVMIYM